MYTVRNPKAFDSTPELGMGYHFGTVENSEFQDGAEGVIVLNSQYALKPNEILNLESLARLLLIIGKEVAQGIVVTMITAPPLVPERSIVPSENMLLLKRSFGHLISNL